MRRDANKEEYDVNKPRAPPSQTRAPPKDVYAQKQVAQFKDDSLVQQQNQAFVDEATAVQERFKTQEIRRKVPITLPTSSLPITTLSVPRENVFISLVLTNEISFSKYRRILCPFFISPPLFRRCVRRSKTRTRSNARYLQRH